MKKFISILFLMLVSLVSFKAFAACEDDPAGCDPSGNVLENPFRGGPDNISDLFRMLVDNVLMPVAGVLAVLAFIYSGFLYVTAAGDEKRIQTAHKALLYTAIGTVLLLGAWGIAQVITGTIDQLRGS